MYDYSRGYAPDIESSGCMDIFRLPKFVLPLLPKPAAAGVGRGGVHRERLDRESATDVRVFSNCEEVELRLNGAVVGRQGPDRDRMSERLDHPPFTFKVGRFEPGELKALGYAGGKLLAEHVVRTPGEIAGLRLALDSASSGPVVTRGRKDHLFCRASLVDRSGTVVSDAWENVAFGAVGGVRLVGANPFATEAGISSILIERDGRGERATVFAVAGVSGKAMSASLGLGGTAVRHSARRTGSGAEIVSGGKVVVSLAADAPKYRIPISAPPDRREPFHR